MKIRLEGTPDDVQAFADALSAIADVHGGFEEYRNRPPSTHVRRYLTAQLRRTRTLTNTSKGGA